MLKIEEFRNSEIQKFYVLNYPLQIQIPHSRFRFPHSMEGVHIKTDVRKQKINLAPSLALNNHSHSHTAANTHGN